MRVDGKTIVVTGGGNGIGRQLVLGLLARGARVAAIDVRQEALDETSALAADAADRLSTHRVDITDLQQVEALPAAVVARHGAVDGLINCAGIIQPFVKVEELTYESIDRVFKVNLFGTIYMTKTFLPHLLERPRAHVLNVSSMGSYVPVPGQVIYGASKAAVKLFTEGLYAEMAGTNVSVTVAFPGATETSISQNSGIDMAAADTSKANSIKMTSAADTAKAILDGMERDAYRVMAGPDAALMDRLSRLAPKRAADIIQKQMASLLPE